MTQIASYRAAVARHLRSVRVARDTDAALLNLRLTDPALLAGRD